jgi:hypothetical protein
MVAFAEGSGRTSDFGALSGKELGNRFTNTAAGSSHYRDFAV